MSYESVQWLIEAVKKRDPDFVVSNELRLALNLLISQSDDLPVEQMGAIWDSCFKCLKLMLVDNPKMFEEVFVAMNNKKRIAVLDVLEKLLDEKEGR